MEKQHEIQSFKVSDKGIFMIVDEQRYEIPLKDTTKLLINATPKERETFEVGVVGIGVHWPLLDEDLSINGLIKTANKK